MAIVPRARSTQSLRALPSGGLQAFDDGNADAINRAGQQLAGAVDAYGDRMDEAAVKQLDVEFSAFDRQQLFGDGTPENKGYANTQGLEALNGRAGVEAAYQAKKLELIGKARSPQQRMMLDDVLSRRVEDSLGRIGGHAARQGEVYESHVRKARILDSAEQAVRDYEDPARFAVAMDTLTEEVMEDSAKFGVEVMASEVRAAQGRVHGAIVERLSLQDPSRALDYLDKHREVIGEDADYRMRRALEPAVKQQEAEEGVDALMGLGGATPGQRFTSTELYSAVAAQESGGRDFDDNGRLITSPAGAQGKMQVMPGTNRDPGYGVRPAQNDSPQERNRVGRDYLDAMMKRYGGDQHLALAAYNAGPGRVDEWLQTIGDPRRGGMSGAEWAARIPIEETRKYVPGVLRRLGSGGPKNAPRDDDLNETLAKIDAMGLAPDDERAWKQEAVRRVSMNRTLLAEQERRLEESAWSTIDAGGRVPPRVMAALPREARGRIETYLHKQAAGADIETDPVAFVEMRRIAAERPEEFAKMDPNSWRGKFSNEDIRTMGGWQAAIVAKANGKGGTPGQDDFAKVAKRLLPTVGVPVGDSLAAQKQAPRVDRFMRQLERRATEFAVRTGKQPTEADLLAMGDGLLIEVRLPGTGGWFGDDKAARIYELPDKRPAFEVDVPLSARSEIVAAFRAKGVEPSSAMIAKAYIGASR